MRFFIYSIDCLLSQVKSSSEAVHGMLLTVIVSACCACIMVLKDLCSNGIFFMHLDFIDLTQDSDDVTSLSPVSLSSSDELPAENGQSSR